MKNSIKLLVLLIATSGCSTMKPWQKRVVSIVVPAFACGMVVGELAKNRDNTDEEASIYKSAGVCAGAGIAVGEYLTRGEKLKEDYLAKENELLKKSDNSHEEFFYKRNLEKLKNFAESDCIKGEKTPVICSDDEGNFINCNKLDMFYVSPNWVGQYNFFYSEKGCFKGKKEKQNLKKHLDQNLKGVKKQ